MIHKIGHQKGNVLMIVMVLFVMLSMSIALGLIVPVLSSTRTASNTLHSKKSYALAESGVEDVLYRLKTSKNVSPNETLLLDGDQVVTTVTDISSEQKQITSVGSSQDRIRNVVAVVEKGVGASFNYGVQTGRGGVVMKNNSMIIGNIYANGNVTGTGEVTGSVIAANSTALAADQINDTPLPPPSSMVFGASSSAQDIAQSFRVSVSAPVNKIQLYIKKAGNPANATVRIVADSNGSPSTTNLLSTQGVLSASAVTSTFGWVDVIFPDDPTLYDDTLYWLIIDAPSNNFSQYYTLGTNANVYTNGAVRTGVYGGSWGSTSTSDGYFRLFIGGLTSKIDGLTVGTGGSGDAWAHTVTNTSVTGRKYCQVGTGCDTSRVDPTPIGFPISEGNIETWKNDASMGATIAGNYTSPNNTTIGPAVITGNLTINGTLTLTGTVWVKGNITMSNNSTVRLSSAYGTSDGVLLSDGSISISNGSTFYGSGTAGSYILVITTSDCPNSASCNGSNAIEIYNNAGAAVLNAQQGTIRLNNNTGLKEATAETLIIDNGAVVTYESGLANMNFSSGPSGSWSIASWKETQ